MSIPASNPEHLNPEPLNQARVSALQRVRIILEMIKFEHTVFALPFALMAALLAARGLPPWRVTGWILVAMIGARSSAMAFNRLVDLEYDRRNPRTAGRALPAGQVTVAQVWAFVLVTTALLFLAAWELNPMAFFLTPVALAVVWGYSFTKRFTQWCHVVLGAAIGIAPSAAWIAVRGTLELPPVLLSAAVALWVGGFDVIYACQDVEFDRSAGLRSLPSRLGIARALLLSRVMHAGTVLLLAALAPLLQMGMIYDVGVLFVAALLAYEHSLVRPDDLSRVNAAFFTVNGWISIGLFLFTGADLIIHG